MKCPLCRTAIDEHSAEAAARCYRRYIRARRNRDAAKARRRTYADPGPSAWWTTYSEDMR